MATASKTRHQAANGKSRKKPTVRRDHGKAAPAPTSDIDEPDRSSAAVADIDADALEFIEALDRFKKQHGRPFPSWSEVLYVLKGLGYRR